MKKNLKEILYWTWCLPQTLVGLVVKLCCKAEKNKTTIVDLYKDKEDVYEYHITKKRFSGISLGKYIIIGDSCNNMYTIKHEHGHQIQSFILGPLYLFVIGLPSIIWCRCFEKYRIKYNKSYYSFYTEKWANKLGKVDE